MCGIVGIVRMQELLDIDRAFLAAATPLLAHRGPDGEGIWIGGGAGFGHRRLSIIDLTSGGQPMHDSTGRYTITFNGEIYNFHELRAFLEDKGCRFQTRSDTEVILNAYAHWGPACVERLRGIFAFGLWDAAERSLFLARDHLGVKPLLYREADGGVIFASELKCIAQHPAVRRAIDLRALSDYLSLGYIMAPKTILAEVRKLPPGCWLRWQDGTSSLHAYWDVAAAAASLGDTEQTEPQVVAQLHARLDQVVKEQLVSDVPLGAFLSGGLDSSTIVQKMTRQVAGRVTTFTIGFREKSYSELPYAQQVARYLGVGNIAETITPELGQLLPRLAWYYDEPFADTSAVPTYMLCQLAARHVKVALSGDGGDECFAGYPTYLADRFHTLYQRVPEWAHRRLVLPLVSRLPTSHGKVSWDYKAKQFVTYARLGPEEAHYCWRLIFSEEQKRLLWGGAPPTGLDGYTPLDPVREHFQRAPQRGFLTRSQYVDLKTWLADAMLVKVDRASMATGIEVRVPLLDAGLVAWALALPDRMKLRGLTTKYALRQAMRTSLPRAILARSKRGFNAPAAHWIKAFVEPMLRHHSDLLPGFAAVARTLWDEHRAQRADHGFRLWTLLNWMLWEQTVLTPTNQAKP